MLSKIELGLIEKIVHFTKSVVELSQYLEIVWTDWKSSESILLYIRKSVTGKNVYSHHQKTSELSQKENMI